MALRGIEWVEVAFPEVNTLVHANVNVPEEVWSHALKAKFRKHGTNPCNPHLLLSPKREEVAHNRRAAL
jgi:hypothetical protein